MGGAREAGGAFAGFEARECLADTRDSYSSLWKAFVSGGPRGSAGIRGPGMVERGFSKQNTAKPERKKFHTHPKERTYGVQALLLTIKMLPKTD